jgi:hypothetical protein
VGHDARARRLDARQPKGVQHQGEKVRGERPATAAAAAGTCNLVAYMQLHNPHAQLTRLVAISPHTHTHPQQKQPTQTKGRSAKTS